VQATVKVLSASVAALTMLVCWQQSVFSCSSVAVAAPTKLVAGAQSAAVATIPGVALCSSSSNAFLCAYHHHRQQSPTFTDNMLAAACNALYILQASSLK
jgi:hypothetical protein